MALRDALTAAMAFPAVSVRTAAGILPLRQVMVAIAGAETAGSWNPAAVGDYGDPGPNCGGYTSWGLWQIHNIHAAYLTAATGSSSACVWARWLSNPVNNAAAALAVYRGQGLSAWSTYTGGQWMEYLQAAQPVAVSGAGNGAGVVGGTGSEAGAATPAQMAPAAETTAAEAAAAGVGGIAGLGITPAEIIVGALALKLFAAGLAAL
jgi:hypothetical protein